MLFSLNPKYVQEAELQLAIQFPEKFILKMIKYNGGEIITLEDDWQIFPFFDPSDQIRIRRTRKNIVSITFEARKLERFPTNGVVIAGNIIGDYLVMLPLQKVPFRLADTIYLWHRKTGGILEIADSIEELLEG